jgi:Zn-dependent protease
VLVCPDCATLIYSRYLSEVARSAQQMEQEQRWAEARARWTDALAWLPPETQQAIGITAHIAQIDARTQAEEQRKAKWTKRLGPFAPVVFFLLKAKSFFFLIFKLKFLLGLFGFFGIYWAIFGWQFAVGITVSIFIHEMGHYVAVKRRGLKADLPIFFPGFGAYVRWYHQGVSREDLAAISLAGPLFGLTAVFASLAIYWGTRMEIFLVLANVGAWLNFFQLFPLFGFDGAQATYALSRLQRTLIAATCLLMFGLTLSGPDPFATSPQWIFLIVGLGMGWRCFNNDVPDEASTKTFLYFQGLVMMLGALVFLTRGAGIR